MHGRLQAIAHYCVFHHILVKVMGRMPDLPIVSRGNPAYHHLAFKPRNDIEFIQFGDRARLFNELLDCYRDTLQGSCSNYGVSPIFPDKGNVLEIVLRNPAEDSSLLTLQKAS